MGKKSKKRKTEGLEKHKQIKRAKKVEKKKKIGHPAKHRGKGKR